MASGSKSRFPLVNTSSSSLVLPRPANSMSISLVMVVKSAMFAGSVDLDREMYLHGREQPSLEVYGRCTAWTVCIEGVNVANGCRSIIELFMQEICWRVQVISPHVVP